MGVRGGAVRISATGWHWKSAPVKGWQSVDGAGQDTDGAGAVCPMCGLQVSHWVLLFTHYRARHRRLEDWIEETGNGD